MKRGGKWDPGNRLEAVRYDDIAWSLSSCAAKELPKPIHAGANVGSNVVALLQSERNISSKFDTLGLKDYHSRQVTYWKYRCAASYL